MGRDVVTLRRKIHGLVRLHLVQPAAAETVPTLDGLLVEIVDGHYHLAAVTHRASASESHELDGDALIPVDRVLYVQRLG